MFRVRTTETAKTFRLAIAELLMLSVAALAVTLWVMVDFRREQEIVVELIQQLPPEAAAPAEELAGELRWQFRLTLLVGLNLIVTGFAMVLLWRAYRSSQDSLRDLKALAGDILSSMDQAVITTDRDGTVTSINRRGIELLSLTGEYVGRPLRELSGRMPLDEFREESQSDRPTEITKDFVTSSNGTTRTLRAFCQPLRDHQDAEIGNVVQLRDVTERVLVDERIRRMERYMGLGSLAAGLHHEIKNPLAALWLHVQLLGEEIDGQAASDEVRGMLDVIKTEVTRVGDVLESFRDFAAFDQLNRTPVDLAKLIERQTKLIGPQAGQQNIALQIQLPAKPLPSVYADCVRLEQVLLNLLVNAMEAMPDGGTLTVRVSMGQDANGEDTKSARIEVIDTGPGIPANVRDCIFDPYFTTKNDGTGMGLALCEKLVRQHNGRLQFHTSESGTVFELTLPSD